ncbi:zinc finger protein 354C-like [Cloeon dipterum]|uniref:zinc finger protein 354C-like n=1 Tax=Cloeon dipterum TaxID=197152 RepID=UPI00321F8FA7
MQPPSVKEGKIPIQKPLCRLCECPTSDGHVLASQVDRMKLRKWAMEVMNLTEEDENLPDVVEEDALICFFCIWQAEFGDESGDEAVAWWPKNLDLEQNARVLRENYSVGEVEQCWVQLEEVDLAKYEKKIPLKSKEGQRLCLYCGKSFNHLLDHVRVYHKEAIKCGIRGCWTFFHTQEEKEQHMQGDLHKPRERMKIRCKYCEIGKLHSSVESWRQHVNRIHPELPVACTRLGCKEYFKSKSEMILHISSSHRQDINQDLYLCKHCEFFATRKSILSRHVEGRHIPKIFKCDSCDAKFGSKWKVNYHVKQIHTLDKCKSCGQDVALMYKKRHRKPSVCSRCKLSFVCSGLYQLHRKSFKQTLLNCEECGKSFATSPNMKCHVQTFHKSAIYRCDHCNYSAFNKRYMLWHMQCQHLLKTIMCEQCKKLFSTESTLKAHMSRCHSFISCDECAQEISRHKMRIHRTIKTCGRCECKFKCQGLLENHIKSCFPLNSNNFCCYNCPKSYGTKKSLYAHNARKHQARIAHRANRAMPWWAAGPATRPAAGLVARRHLINSIP